MFPPAPEVFDGVEFGCVGGEAFYPYVAALVAQELADFSAAVGGEAVPDDEEFAGGLFFEAFEEVDDLV